MSPEITKLIEQYLAGELSANDTQIFEDRLSNNTELQAEVDFQKSIHEAAKRSALRTEINSVAKQFHFSNTLKWGGMGLGILLVAAISIFYLTTTNFSKENRSDSNSDSKFNVEDARALTSKLENEVLIDHLKSEFFAWNASDTAFLSKEGILVSVPNNAFLLNGKPYEDDAIIQWQEALDGGTIVKSGLSTTSNGKLLETQGMFSFTAKTKDGKQLTINPKVGVYVQVPVDEYKSGMKLFDGEKDSAGNINWIKPRDFEKIPLAVPMDQLDFYPSQYEPKLNELKAGIGKKYRDSLYLSFEQEEVVEKKVESSIKERLPVVEHFNSVIDVRNEPIKKRRENNESLKGGPSSYEPIFPDIPQEAIRYFDSIGWDGPTGIPPSSVLGFWNQKFNNTLLSTREFEARMKEIHKTCDKSVLEIYTANLNKSMSELDQRAVAKGYPQFRKFADEQVGKLNASSPHLDGLQAFYQQAIKGYKEDSKAAWQAEKARREKWDASMKDERQSEKVRTSTRDAQLFQEEYTLNHANVRKQLGRVLGATIYGNNPICNIDRFVMKTTLARKTAEFYDSETGKTARIQYNDFTFSIAESGKYKQLYAYLFPDQLNSYHRLSITKGIFSYSLNEAITYDLAIVGISEDGYAFSKLIQVKGGKLGEIRLENVSENEVDQQIEKLNAKRGVKYFGVKEELRWLKKEQQNYVEQKKRSDMKAFRDLVRPTVFPCVSEVAGSFNTQKEPNFVGIAKPR